MFPINLQPYLHVNDNLAVYFNRAECTAAGGTWIDPFSGGLNSPTGLPYCSLSEKVYVLVSAPQTQPNTIYAYVPPDQFVLVYQNGVRVNQNVDPWFSVGPIPQAVFGPMPLVGTTGRVFVSLRTGRNLESSVEIQQAQINVNTLEGNWWVSSENYKGTSYTYGSDMILSLIRNPDGMSYSGTWGSTPVVAHVGDGITYLYKIEFLENRIFYEYVVTSLDASEMKGKWRLTFNGKSSNWETFVAMRRGQSPGVTNPFLTH